MSFWKFFKRKNDPEPVAVDSSHAHSNGADVMIEKILFKGEKGEPKKEFFEVEPLTIQFFLKVCVPISFGVNLFLSVYRLPDRNLVLKDNMQRDGVNITWLPQGQHLIEWQTTGVALREGNYSIVAEVAGGSGTQCRVIDSQEEEIKVLPAKYFEGSVSLPHEWRFSSHVQTHGGKGLSWQKGHKDWFYKHFDHAADVVIKYMFDHSDLLRGRILDVGCGEGITDLGIVLRVHPEILVGIDIEGNFKELPRIMRENGLPFSEIPKNLVFHKIDAKKIPYPDDYFDVAISWALLEHVPGSYDEVLEEVKRVLKDGGLLFLHPGLYYGSSGHHLGEFTQEPFVHLRRSEEELKEIVFTAQPNYIDRGGLQYTPEDFWRYYSELNKITVSEIEGKLRRLKFEFKKVAVRAEDLVIYDKTLQAYSIQDLTTREIYMALINHKG